MIVPMSKVTLLCAAADEARSLDALRELGVLHLVHLQSPEGEDLDQRRQELASAQRALDLVPPGMHHAAPSGRAAPEVVAEVGSLLQRRRKLEEELDALHMEYHRVLPFGSFEPESVLRLREEGIAVTLYRASTKQPPVLPDDAVHVPLSADKNHRYFALVATSDIALEGAEEMALPTESATAMAARIEEAEQAVASVHTELAAYAGDRPALEAYCTELEDDIRFLEARAGMAEGAPASYLQGFCPEEKVEALREASRSNGWGLLAAAPTDEDEVPTLLRNPKWVQLIRPMQDFIGILPGYHEVDISRLFLLFFSLFFGMIVGDAGYGLIFLVATLWARKRYPSARLVTSMMVVMSLCTMIWGALTGNFFGIQPESLPAPLARFRVNWLTDQDHVMYLCFLIGAIHLTIAHLWNALRAPTKWLALAQIGWIGTTWAMFFFAGMMILGLPFPPLMYIPLAVGFVLILLFMTPLRRVKSEWFNYVTLPLSLVNNFVDVVSYVRLFAVGMATYAVASAFNEMAMGLGFGHVLSGFGAAVVLLLGHTLNIALAVMGVLVHGIRLNALEFSSHLGLEWTGSAYTPFKKHATELETDH